MHEVFSYLNRNREGITQVEAWKRFPSLADSTLEFAKERLSGAVSQLRERYELPIDSINKQGNTKHFDETTGQWVTARTRYRMSSSFFSKGSKLEPIPVKKEEPTREVTETDVIPATAEVNVDAEVTETVINFPDGYQATILIHFTKPSGEEVNSDE